MSADRDTMERREGANFVVNMPGDGPWKMTSFQGDLVVTSLEHGAYRLKQDNDELRWEKIEVWP